MDWGRDAQADGAPFFRKNALSMTVMCHQLMSLPPMLAPAGIKGKTLSDGRGPNEFTPLVYETVQMLFDRSMSSAGNGPICPVGGFMLAVT
jgi:hypothetical protein